MLQDQTVSESTPEDGLPGVALIMSNHASFVTVGLNCLKKSCSLTELIHFLIDTDSFAAATRNLQEYSRFDHFMPKTDSDVVFD